MEERAEDSAPGPGRLPSYAPEIGTTFDGRFAIERIAGRGGMGYVLLARHLELEQPVAIKLLAPERELDEKSSRRLLHEARACVRIKSQHVVRVLDVVSGRQTPPYIVMEFLEGEDLACHLQRVGQVSEPRAVEIVAQACEAVGEAHRLGMVHRDLKPGNLFLCKHGDGRDVFVKVLDFGISKTEAAGAESLTQSHALLGSPSYAAPEQLQASHDVDARADIWSLGVILYELVVGKRPFEGSSLAQVCTRILQDQPALPEGLSAPLSGIVRRCLEKDPRRRYPSVEALLQDLAELSPAAVARTVDYLGALPRMSTELTPARKAPEPAASSATLTGTTQLGASATSPRPSASRRWRGALLSLVPALLLLAWLHGRATAPTAPLAPRTASAAAPVLVALSASTSSPLAPPMSSAPASVAPRESVSASPVARSARPKTPGRATPAPAVSSVPWVESR